MTSIDQALTPVDGISCFKYLEGDYGTGKTQFIQCLALRAQARNIVTSIVNVFGD